MIFTLSRIKLLPLSAMLFIVFISIAAIFLPYLLSLDPYSVSDQLLHPPSFTYLLGTDDLGRDMFSRLIYGARNTLSIGFVVVLFSLVIGSLLGLLATVYQGSLALFVDYINDMLMSFPSILLAIVLLALLGPGLVTCVIAVTVITIPGFVRVVKTVATREINKDYIQAARTSGLSRLQILRSELLPNCSVPIIVQATFAFSEAILMISVLGFLRLGVNPPMAEWGSMLADVYQFMESNPYLVIFPGLCIWTSVFAINVVGDGLLEWLDHNESGSHIK